MREQRWRETADKVGEFRTTHGRWPSRKDSDADARALGVWLVNQRVAARGSGPGVHTSAERRSYLDRVAPGWRGQDLDAEWTARARDVAAYRRAHGTLPSSKSQDSETSKLGKWLSKQKTAARQPEPPKWFTEERRRYLDDVAPGWTDRLRND